MEQRIRPEQKKIRLDLAPGTAFWFAPLIAILEILMFFWMIFSGVNALSPDPIRLFEFGANQRSAILEGELWRLFTALFIHRGIFHLVVNVFVLWLVGRVLEPLLGWKNIALLMLFGGIVGNTVSFFWYSYMLSVGASAMVYALFGAMLVLLFTQSSYFRDLIPHIFLLLILFTLQTVYGFFNENVDHAAHIGGILAGILAGIGLSFSQRRHIPELPLRGTLGLLTLFSFMSVVIWGKSLNNPLADYQHVLKVLKTEKKESEKAWLAGMDSSAFGEGIMHWQAMADTAGKYQTEEMPEVLLAKLQSIELYARLRQKQYAMVIDYITGNGTFIYPLYQENKESIRYMEEAVFGK